jgi:hypothetical protein
MITISYNSARIWWTGRHLKQFLLSGRYLVRRILRGGIGRNRERWQNIGKPMVKTWQIRKIGPSSKIIAIKVQLQILPCLLCI